MGDQRRARRRHRHRLLPIRHAPNPSHPIPAPLPPGTQLTSPPGAMISLSGVTVPVILDTITDTPTLLRQWARMYHYGHIAAPSMAVTTLAMYIYSATRCAGQKQTMLLAAGATTILIVPFTFAFMVSTNNVLFGLKEGSDAGKVVEFEGARDLVVKWTKLHFARSLFPLAGAMVGLAATS